VNEPLHARIGPGPLAAAPSVAASSAAGAWEGRWREIISGQARGPAAALARVGLRTLAGLYAGVIGAYRAAYDLGLLRTVTAPCQVISVGNLTVGGTGKTTTVRWLAGWLRDRGVPVAVLSYGYRAGSDAAVTVVSDGERVLVPASVGGDEPRMLAEALPGVPVLIGKRRQLSAEEAVRQFGARVCVLDDAFQYWRLVKDLEIVLIDARCPFGYGHLLPRGLLREATRQLRRADVLLLTNAHRQDDSECAALKEHLARLHPEAVLVEACHTACPLRPLARHGRGATASDCTAGATIGGLSGRRVMALSSLGNPEGFEEALVEQGAEVVSARFPDHHSYRADEVRREVERARLQGCAAIVTTEKDAVKLDPDWLEGFPGWVLPVALGIVAGREALEERLEALVA
jgi:tetraacyldisaccharide 4'-kinase